MLSNINILATPLVAICFLSVLFSSLKDKAKPGTRKLPYLIYFYYVAETVYFRTKYPGNYSRQQNRKQWKEQLTQGCVTLHWIVSLAPE